MATPRSRRKLLASSEANLLAKFNLVLRGFGIIFERTFEGTRMRHSRCEPETASISTVCHQAKRRAQISSRSIRIKLRSS